MHTRSRAHTHRRAQTPACATPIHKCKYKYKYTYTRARTHTQDKETAEDAELTGKINEYMNNPVRARVCVLCVHLEV